MTFKIHSFHVASALPLYCENSKACKIIIRHILTLETEPGKVLCKLSVQMLVEPPENKNNGLTVSLFFNHEAD